MKSTLHRSSPAVFTRLCTRHTIQPQLPSDNFGADNIFIDIDTIKPGQDFIKTIGQSVIVCDSVLAVIGPRWLTEKDAAGQRRLDRADDLVRMEIATALKPRHPGHPCARR